MGVLSAFNPYIVQESTVMSRRKVRPRETIYMPKVILLDKGTAGLAPKSHLTPWKDGKERYCSHSA